MKKNVGRKSTIGSAPQPVTTEPVTIDGEHPLLNVTIPIEAHTYGLLVAGGAVHGQDWKLAARLLLSETACRWSNNNFAIGPDNDPVIKG